jgi:SAM-dependent methyltransferase
MQKKTHSTFWNDIPAAWDLIGPPLRPSPEDVAIIENILPNPSSLCNSSSSFETLLLGVTPEIAALNWPAETRLTAVDRAAGMIARVWPGNRENRIALCGDWLKLPFRKSSFDFVIGDGCLLLLDYPDGYRRLFEGIRHVLAEDGALMLRVFCRPNQTEAVDDVFHALQARQIGSFDAFKWRFLMAIQGGDVLRGVELAEAWDIWHEITPDPSAFAAEYGWPLAKVSVMDAYRNDPSSYHFPSVDEVCAAMGDTLKLVKRIHGAYELADRCPHLLFKPQKVAL